MSTTNKRTRASRRAAPPCSAFDEDGEPMPTEHEAIAVASALIEHYEPTPDLAGSDFDKGMQALQRLMGRRPNKEISGGTSAASGGCA
jgi:hypothetical protein